MKRGFTLVEILLVLALIAVIGLISFVSVDKILNTSKQKALEAQYKLIEQAARNYVSNNMLEDLEDEFNLTIDFLTTNSYLSESQIKDPTTGNNINGCVRVYKENNIYKYSYQNTCN